MNCVMLLPFVVIPMIFAKPIVSLFFPADFVGEAFAYAVRYATFYLPFLYLQMVGHLLHSYMRSLGKVSVVLGITIVTSLVRIFATFLLVPQLDLEGVYPRQVLSWIADTALSVILYLFCYRTLEHIQRAVQSVYMKKSL